MCSVYMKLNCLGFQIFYIFFETGFTGKYFQDYKKISMAMSFTMLVTDRMLQTDSSRWITRLYEPVY